MSSLPEVHGLMMSPHIPSSWSFDPSQEDVIPEHLPRMQDSLCRTCLCMCNTSGRSPMHIHVVGPAPARQLRDVAFRRLCCLAWWHCKGLLHAAAAQINGCNCLLLWLAQVAQQVVQCQPGKASLISPCTKVPDLAIHPLKTHVRSRDVYGAQSTQRTSDT